MNLPRFSPVKKTIFAILVLLLGSPSLIHADCGGVVRWSIKVGSDAGASKIPAAIAKIPSIADWGKLKRPAQSIPDKDQRYVPAEAGVGSEATRYQIVGYLISFKKQADDDYHLVLNDQADGKGATMVAEVVNPDCVKGARDDGPSPSYFDGDLKQARKDFGIIIADSDETLDPPVLVRLTGLGFFDTWNHGSGQSRTNYMEMHPVLEIVKVAQ